MSFSKLIPAFKKSGENKDYSKLMREDCEMELKVPKENFDQSVGKIGLGLQSSIFPLDDDAHFKWQIDFYPLGLDEDFSGYCSVFLDRTWKKIQIPVSATVSFEMKTEMNVSVKTEEIDCVYEEHESYGSRKFYETNKLKNFSADHFLICAKIYTYYEANSCLTSNFLSERELLHNYSSLFENGAFSDLILCTKQDETEFNVHRGILASRSTVFGAMLSNDMKEKQTGRIEIHDLSSSAVKSMLHFIYSCEVKFENAQNTLDLLEASEKYDLKDLKLQCAEYLAEIIDKNNVGVILVDAHRYNLFNLKATCLRYICKNEDKFSDRKQYQVIREKNSELLLDIITEFSKYIDVDKL